MGGHGGGMAASGSHPSLQGLVNQGPLFAQGQGQGQMGPGAPGWAGGPLYGSSGHQQQPQPMRLGEAPSGPATWDLQSMQNEQVLRAQLELIKGGLDPSIIPQVSTYFRRRACWGGGGGVVSG